MTRDWGDFEIHNQYSEIVFPLASLTYPVELIAGDQKRLGKGLGTVRRRKSLFMKSVALLREIYLFL